MVPGFNHNIKHNGKVYHIQTEDSGKENPHVITHIFVGGNILATTKTSYEDIVNISDLERIVRELMEEQHKSMLRNLINGVYDEGGAVVNDSAVPPVVVSPAVSPDKSLDEIILSYLADGADE